MHPGDQISHYEILEKLGSGGMGVVFKARDSLLNRPVALKFLPSHLSADRAAKERFIQEAQAASALDHSSICTIYEIGETEQGELFIAMAFYEGQTLKYRLDNEEFPVSRAVDIAGQLVRGLQRAHEAGIVHRDVKPANIMITDRGEVKLLDFGLAKLAGGADLTAEGSTLGTTAYMSPEQARGDEVGPAADVWSLGAVVYEMLARRKPFRGDYDQAVIYAILNEMPKPVREVNRDVDEDLDSVVMRCLDKDPRRRPSLPELRGKLVSGSGSHVVMTASASSPCASRPPVRNIIIGAAALLLVALAVVAWLTTRSPPSYTNAPVAEAVERRPSVAVLPFTARSSDEDDVYFAGGIHDDILTQLAKIKALKVISRTSVMQYAGGTKSIREVGDELGVATVLEGAVDRAGDRIRLNVQLIDTDTDEHLWAETYDEQLTAANVFAIRSDLAQKVAISLKAALSPEEASRIGARPTESLEAYDLYGRGQYVMTSAGLSSESFDRAESLFRKSIEEDPSFAPAYAGLAKVYYERWAFLGSPPEENLPEASRLAERALELDADLAEAHLARGLVLMANLDYTGAEKEFVEAIEVNPGLADAHRRYAFLLRRTGRNGEAVRELVRAIEIDPLNIRTRASYASMLQSIGDHEGSLAETRKILDLEPGNVVSYYMMGTSYSLMGRHQDAIASFSKARALDPADPYNTAGLAFAHANAGDVDRAHALMAEMEETGAMTKEKAIIYGVLGDLDKAFELMERAYEMDPGILAEMETDRTITEEMRRDSRFREILDRLTK